MKDQKTIYDLKLGESVIQYSSDETKYFITRVPGGWIYESNSLVFVPFNNEFQNK